MQILGLIGSTAPRCLALLVQIEISRIVNTYREVGVRVHRTVFQLAIERNDGNFLHPLRIPDRRVRQTRLKREIRNRSGGIAHADELRDRARVGMGRIHPESGLEKERRHLPFIIGEMIAKRHARAALAGSKDDLRRRLRVRVDLIGDRFGRTHRVKKRDRREVDLCIELLAVSSVGTHFTHQLRRQRPPDFEFADIHRENLGTEFVRRHIRGRVIVKLGIVRVFDRIHGVFRKFPLRPDPSGIEEPVLSGKRRAYFLRESDPVVDVNSPFQLILAE